MKRIYGRQKTSLSLSEEAERIYSVTDPMTIIEHDDGEGNLSYSIPDFCESGLTAEDVEAFILGFADDEEEDDD